MRRHYGYGISRPSMGSYIKFAWRDAMELAALLEETYTPAEVYRLYEEQTQEELSALEAKLRGNIAALIEATESRRPPILRKIEKETGNQAHAMLALVFAIMAQERAMEELDRLKPGDGNRATCVQCYLLEGTRRHSRIVYEFPHDVFDAYGSSADFFGD